jgi:hypothetical protein
MIDSRGGNPGADKDLGGITMNALDKMHREVAMMRKTKMDPTAALIQILQSLKDGDREQATYELTELAECLGENRHGFMPDVNEAVETFTERNDRAACTPEGADELFKSNLAFSTRLKGVPSR